MKKRVLFIQGGGQGAHSEDGLLVASLRKALGAAYDVRYPKMRNGDSPEMPAWKAQIAAEIGALGDGVILVGHSVGGVALLKYLSEDRVEHAIAGLFLIAVPSWDDEHWSYDELRLPHDIAARLSRIPRVFLYHSRDDEIVPFAHLALHAARLPQATVRKTYGRGPQFGNDLSDVAKDMMSEEPAASTRRVRPARGTRKRHRR